MPKKILSTARNAVRIPIIDLQEAHFIEELCWTVEGVESVAYQLDDAEQLCGLEIIGRHAELEHDLIQVFAEHSIPLNLEPVRTIAEEDWAESWKRFWHVNRLLPHVVVCPSWESFVSEPNDIVLDLDPGSAFGTGTHETTQLMLYLVSRLDPAVKSLLDVGTGSGILAIVAAKRGVALVTGVDNDSLAVSVAQANSDRNGVQMQCSDATLEAFEKPFDVVLANILAPVIVDLMPELKRVLAQDGQLMLSGITHLQVNDVHQALAANGLVLTRLLQKGAWVALVAKHAER